MYEGDLELDDLSIPHTSVLKAETIKDGTVDMLVLICRDFRKQAFSFLHKEHKKVLRFITNYQSPSKLSQIFAFTFKLNSKIDGWATYSLKKEYLERQKLGENKLWRVVTANRQFDLCDSYPKEFIVPMTVRDGSVYHVAQFRTKGRVPALCWVNPQTSACLWRCAQLTPIVVQDMVGMAKIRCKEDEEVLDMIKRVHQPLIIIGAGGEEVAVPTPESRQAAAESNMTLRLSVPSVDELKAEMARFREVCINENPIAVRARTSSANLMSSASDLNSTDRREGSGPSSHWMKTVGSVHQSHVGALLTAAKTIADLMSNPDGASSVMCQEPNGDNLCTLLVSLAQLMMEPYYRSIKGFAVLFEKEWLSFGHKFIDLKKSARTSGAEVVSTLFTLYMDCVWQLMRQYPQSFEFTETLLIFLLDSVYSCQFGTFWCASERERDAAKVTTKTPSIWSYVPLRLDIFRNTFYQMHRSPKSSPFLLWPPAPDFSVGALAIWNGYYLQHVSRFAISERGKVIQSQIRRDPTIPLHLQGAGLPSFPIQLAPRLNKLESLNLSGNFLNFLPCEISFLTSLKDLRIDDNQISLIPAELFNLLPITLTTLSCANNSIESLPESINRLTALEYLDLRNNNLLATPLINFCPRLNHLDLSNNRIFDLNVDFSTCPSLGFLDLSCNNISCLPESIETLTDVVLLKLSNNKLTTLPHLRNMTTLLSLDISGLDSLTGNLLPLETAQIASLQHLNLRNMKLKGFPPTVNLPRLLSLDLSHNELVTLPESVATIPSLISLNLEFNKIEAIPIEVRCLTLLTELRLNDNMLTALSPGLGGLGNLDRLKLSNNPCLKELPASISKLSQTLTRLKLKNMPKLIQPPPSVVSKGLPDIMSYLSQLHKGQERMYRLKLMIVGQENVGKTTLLKSLMRNKNDRQVSTDGIDIITYEFLAPVNDQGIIDGAGPNQRTVHLSCWDFGGQEVYYPTHQFFLSACSVYVLVWSFLFPDELSRIEFWLDSIRHRAPQCRIILVGTHADEKLPKHVDVDQVVAQMKDKWKPRYPAIVDIVAVSNVTQKGIEDFRVLLENVVLNDQSVGAALPSSYLVLERLFEAEANIRDPPLITFSKLREMGEVCGLSSQTDLLTAVKLMHNLGVIIYFHDDEFLRNIVFLKPQWLTRVMSSIITTRHTYVKRGILEHQHLRQIWRAPDFPPAIHPTLLALLNKFDLTASRTLQIQTGDEFYQGSSLVPSLLPEEPPDALSSVWPPSVSSVWVEVGRRYHFEFIPRGFFSRLLVRCLHFCEPQFVWKNGLILSEASGQLSLRIYPEKARRYLDVLYRFVRTEPAKIVALARLVIDAVDVLQGTWFDVPLQVGIPCSHCISSKSPEIGMLTLSTCEQVAIAGQDTVACPLTGVPVQLAELAPDVAMSSMKNFIVDYDDLVIDRELGVGGYAVVYKGTQGGRVVAIKKMNFGAAADATATSSTNASISSTSASSSTLGSVSGTTSSSLASTATTDGTAEAFAEFRREIWIMSELSHPCLVAMTGFCMRPCCIITEFVACGDLYQFIHSEHPLPFEMALRIAMDICKGMGFLHNSSPPLLHRDLKSPNVLLASRDPTAPVVAKVADFGLTQALATDASGRAVANPVWLAPEIMKKKPYSFESDVYSFGVMSWELVTRKNFFGETAFMSAIENRVEKGERPEIPKDTEQRYQVMIEDSWADRPNDRPSFITLQIRLREMIADLYPHLLPVSEAHMTSLATSKAPTSAFEHSASEALIHRSVRARLETSRHSYMASGSIFPTKLGFRADNDLGSVPSPSMSFAASSMTSSQSLFDLSSLREIKTIVTASSRRQTVPPKSVVPFGPAGSTITTLYFRAEAGELWVGLSNGWIYVCNPEGSVIYDFQGTESSVQAVHVTHNLIWIAGENGRVRVLTNERPPKLRREIVLIARCFATFGKLLYIGTASGLAIFEAAKPSSLPKKFVSTDSPITALLFTGKLLWLACGRNILRGPRESFKISNTLQGHQGTITTLLEVGAVVWSASEDNNIRIWDGENGTTIKVLPGHESKITSLALLKKMVLSGSTDFCLRSWYAEDRLLATEDLVTFDAPVSCIAATNIGVCVASGQRLYFWPETGIEPV